MDIRVGSRRIVFRTKRRVFKIPRFTRWVSFIRGINENLEERYWFSADGSRRRNPSQKWNTEISTGETGQNLAPYEYIECFPNENLTEHLIYAEI